MNQHTTLLQTKVPLKKTKIEILYEESNLNLQILTGIYGYREYPCIAIPTVKTHCVIKQEEYKHKEPLYTNSKILAS